ncbi:MAG: WG repeat-containing protein [Bacteroidales bacterium]|nr:WG repeat-containing protein [Bacteroidales bacterium]
MKRILSITIMLLTIVTLSYAQNYVAKVRLGKQIKFIDETGKVVINLPGLQSAKSFSDGMCMAKANDKWGYINKKGEWVIKPVYVKANSFHEGLALVNDGIHWFFINKSGEKLNAVSADKYGNFKDGYSIVRKGKRKGIIDKTGKLVVDFKYDAIKQFRDGYAVAYLNKMAGIIDGVGNVVIDFKYNKIGRVSEGFAWAKKGAQNGYINIETKEFKVIPGALVMKDFKNGMARVLMGKRFGYIDKTMSFVIDPVYGKAKDFENGYAAVMNLDKSVASVKRWGFIDKEGKLIVNYTYLDAEAFYEGLAPVKLNKANWGFINESGKLVIPAHFDLGMNLSWMTKNRRGFGPSGLARVKKNKKWGFIDVKGNVLNQMWYDGVEPFVDVR